MNNLVIFYSLEGHTKFIAQKIAEKINGNILEIKPKKEYVSSGFKKYFWGGKSVVFKEKPELLPYDVNIDDYDNIFIGTPIWVGTYVPVYNTFFDKENIHDKNIYLFASHEGGGAEKFYKNIKEVIPNNKFNGKIDFNRSLKDKEDIIKDIEMWLDDMYFNK